MTSVERADVLYFQKFFYLTFSRVLICLYLFIYLLNLDFVQKLIFWIWCDVWIYFFFFFCYCLYVSTEPAHVIRVLCLYQIQNLWGILDLWDQLYHNCLCARCIYFLGKHLVCEDAFKNKWATHFVHKKFGISVLSDLLHIPRLLTWQVCNVIGAF